MLISKRKLESLRIAFDKCENTVKRIKLNHDFSNSINGYHCHNVDDTMHVLPNSVDKLSICLTPKQENIDKSHTNIQTKSYTSNEGVFQLTIQFQSMHVD